jgi:hypothetical protein
MWIAKQPCTYLASSGLHWNRRIEGRAQLTNEALDFVGKLLNAPIPRIALENPVGCISSQIRKPDQTIQPWWFGDDASKKTCLWLKNLPPLRETNRLQGDDKTRRANQTASGQNKLGPSPDRWKERSRTYQGIADAMAAQWGNDDNRISLPTGRDSGQTSLFGRTADVRGIGLPLGLAQRMDGGHEGAIV